MSWRCRLKIHHWDHTPDRNFRRCCRCLTLQVQDHWERSGWSEYAPPAGEALRLWDEIKKGRIE